MSSNDNEHGSAGGLKVPKIAKGTSKEAFSKWESLFASFALVKGFGLAITTEDIPDLPTKHPSVLALTGTDAEIKMQKKAVYINDIGVAYLKLATAENNRAAKCFVKCCDQNSYPQGKATEFFKLLQKKFGPKLGFRGTNLRDLLSNVKWSKKKKNGSTKFFEDIATIQMIAQQIKSDELKDKDYVNHLVRVLPDKYKPKVELLLEKDTTTYDAIEEAIEEYDAFWNKGDMKLSSSDEDSDDEDSDVEEEAALAAGTDDKNAKKPRCYICDEIGHFARNCPNRKSSQGYKGKSGGRFKGKCNHCGKIGHKEADCWEKEKNASKRPKSWKRKDDTALANTELMLCHIITKEICYENAEEYRSDDESAHHDSEGDSIPDLEPRQGIDPFFNEYDSSDEEFSDNEDDDTFYTDDEEDIALATLRDYSPTDKHMFIADSAATADVATFTEGVKSSSLNVKDKQIVDNGGQKLSPTIIGTYPFVQIDKKGNEVNVGTLKSVWAGSAFEYNLFSIPKRLKEGWKMVGDKKCITLSKGPSEIKFDIAMKVGGSLLYGTILKPRNEDVAAAGMQKSKSKSAMSILEAHMKFGHIGEADTRKTAQACGYELKRGNLKPCESCAIAKAKQKSVLGKSEGEKATKPNERMYLDNMTIKPPANVDITIRNKNMRLIVDEYTSMSFADFQPKKSGFIEKLCVQMHNWKENGKQVKFVRMDNAPENFKFIKEANGPKWKLNLVEEATGAATPQRNSLVERKFATHTARMRAMTSNAESNDTQRTYLANEALNCAVMLDWLMVTEINGVSKTRAEHWFGEIPKFAKHLRIWGEAGVVKTRTMGTAKIQDRGVTMMFVGYNQNMGGDVYRMWNKDTKRIHNSRDIQWLNVYFNNRTRKVNSLLPDPSVGENDQLNYDTDEAESNIDKEDSERSDDTSDSDSSSAADDHDEDDDAEETSIEDPAARERSGDNHDERKSRETSFPPTGTTRSGRTVQRATMYGDVAAAAADVMDGNTLQLHHEEAKWLAAAIILSDADTVHEEREAIRNIRSIEHACVGAGLGGGFQNTMELKPMKFKKAMMSSDKEEWLKAVEKEHDNMKEYNVWTPEKLQNVPAGAKILTSTWAMKKKANGTFRARCNARGYEEIDGVHFDGSSIAAPVTNELSVRILIVMMLMSNWTGHVLDVKGAFLRGEFEPGLPPMYMKVPEGFEKFYPKDCVLRLLRTIYGLKEAAMAFWKEMLKAFGHMGYERSNADSCLYFKWTAAGFLIAWLSWVDDCVCFGRANDVKASTDEMKNLFECDDVGEFDEYVGCRVDRDGNELKMTQPVLIRSFEDEFDLGNVKSAETPGAPGSVLTPVIDDEDAVDKSLQTKFRSGVGKLLHLMRWSRPEVSNAVRDLSRHGQKCNKAHIMAMKRCMQYCVETKEMGWHLKPERMWDGKDRDFEFVISGKSDSDYACCPATRRSITGLSVFLEGAAVSVRSAMQKIVALSVTEAETIAAVQCAQELLLTYKIVKSMGLEVKLPMILEVDNKGAVDLANSWSHGGRTKHMQVRNFWLRELKEKGLIKVVWIAGAENAADLFTKNLSAGDFKKHREKFVSE